MNGRLVIGLTGGVATGKSAVTRIFKGLGCSVISADDIAHKLTEPGKKCWSKIIKYFGENILNEDKTLNRKKLGEIVFSDSKKREALNKIVHPEVLKLIKTKIELLRNTSNKPIILEIPLLIEADALNLVDKVVVVKANKETQIKRLMENRDIDKLQAEKIISSQMPISEKLKYADYVIDNNSSILNTRNQIKKIYNSLV